ncbi:MAG: tRNA preQ1(34) S-adenosylmethionine ribosyltransferase-isomerase QueA [Prevotella sp.]|nr:tRNA preQ1(34) S-adenosylmethionine ribosyltransferase-isomerase QueA [Candidatus Equicola stercoris]
MKLSEFNFFTLTDKDIALNPPLHRDECKMMVIHKKSGEIEMFKKDENGKPLNGKGRKKVFIEFRDIINYFDEGDTFVFNDTKVLPARLFGTKEKTDANIEVYLLRELNKEMRLWDVIVEPARKIRIGNKLFFDESGSMVAEVIDNTTSRGRTLRFLYECSHEEFKEELFKLGEAPLPEYIISRRKTTADDLTNFQCLFAKKEGAVTAPASGLHFSRELLKRMEIKDINKAFVTLHTSFANFNDIDVEDLSKYKMDSEQMEVNDEACHLVNNAKEEGHHVVAVGTSVVRTLETAVGTDGKLKEYEGWTNKFIFPPYNCQVADCMVGNFYHPLSTLLMVECAFGGYDLMVEAYKLALENGYKFGCYGDAILILND